MKFTMKSVSKYGTAYYVRDGFKQTLAIPAAQFPTVDGVSQVPAEIDITLPEGASFAEKAVRTQATGIAKALKAVDPETRKKIREAGRKAEREALEAAGISL